jgi:hypothetical protein
VAPFEALGHGQRVRLSRRRVQLRVALLLAGAGVMAWRAWQAWSASRSAEAAGSAFPARAAILYALVAALAIVAAAAAALSLRGRRPGATLRLRGGRRPGA